MDKKTTDESLISDILSKNSSSALISLFERHQKMFYCLSQRILSGFPLEADEFESRKLLTLFEAVKSYDPQKNVKFSTWLYNCIRFSCLNSIKNANKKVDISDNDLASILDTSFIKNNVSAKSQESIIDSIRDVLSSISDENIKNVIHLRYFSNSSKIMNYSQIAKKLNVTPQTALNWHNKFIKLAKKKLTHR